MKLKRSTKIMLAVGTFWPVVYIFVFMAFVLGMVVFSGGGPGGGDPNLEPVFGIAFIIIFVLHMFTIFLSLGLTVFYLVHVIKNEALKSEMKAVWAVLFFFMGIFAQPVYWYLNIWRESPVTEGSTAYLHPPEAASWISQDLNRPGAYVPPNEPPDWR
jgi:hypothetical protein